MITASEVSKKPGAVQEKGGDRILDNKKGRIHDSLVKSLCRFLDSADTIAAFAAEMSEFLKTSELTETKAFVGSFVKEVVVKPGRAAIVYSIPTPEDSPIGGADAAEIALNGRVMNSVRHGGPEGTRTPDFHTASVALSQLSYRPTSQIRI